MKINFIYFFSLLFVFSACTKDEINEKAPCEEGTDEIFSMLDSPPIFYACDQKNYDPQCKQKIKDFIDFFLNYPEEARRANIEGNVILYFIIEKGGCITHVEIISPLGYGCDEEAIRLIRLMPDWKPGTARGVPQRLKYQLSIEFKL